MTQDEKWNEKYRAVKNFVEVNHRNPSRYDDVERGLYLNWIKHNKKLLHSGALKEDRVDRFNALLVLIEQNKRKNQHE